MKLCECDEPTIIQNGDDLFCGECASRLNGDDIDKWLRRKTREMELDARVRIPQHADQLWAELLDREDEVFNIIDGDEGTRYQWPELIVKIANVVWMELYMRSTKQPLPDED